MSSHVRITKKIVNRVLAGEELDLSEYTAIEDAAAESLSKHERELFLVGLTSLSDVAAKSLSKHKGDLWLNGLTSLSDAAAESFSNHKGRLSLRSLTSLSEAAAESLSKNQGGLSLFGLTSLSDAAAKSLSKHEGGLSLNLENLSESAADILREHPSFCQVEDSESEDEDGELADDDDLEDSNEDLPAGEEPIEGVFDPGGWELPTSGKVSWSSLLEVAGPAREASLVTKYEWQNAQRENRVLTIVHTGDGMCYAGKVGLHLDFCHVLSVGAGLK